MLMSFVLLVGGAGYYVKTMNDDIVLLKQQNQTYVLEKKQNDSLEEQLKEQNKVLETIKQEKLTLEANIATVTLAQKKLEEENRNLMVENKKALKIQKEKQVLKAKQISAEKKLAVEKKRKLKKLEEAKKKKALAEKKKREAKKKVAKKEKKRSRLLENIAKTKLGRRYVWGAVGPGTFDCSGFTSFVYKKTGVNIPRTSRNQSKYGKYIKRQELKEGDLIFFDTSRPAKGVVNHVGIYIGNNKFIHASSAKKKVVITSLSKPFYSQRYKWARRVVN